MTQNQSKAMITAITLFVIAVMLIIGSINIFGEYSRCKTIYGIFMLIAGIACIGTGFNFLIKAGVKIFKNIEQ